MAKDVVAERGGGCMLGTGGLWGMSVFYHNADMTRNYVVYK